MPSFFRDITGPGGENRLPAAVTGQPSALSTDSNGKSETLNLIEKEDWAKNVFEKLKRRTDLYANLTDAQPDWLLSRLAMYWKSHATDVYIKGETFDHAGG